MLLDECERGQVEIALGHAIRDVPAPTATTT
jgi:hypothetical protein